MDFDGLFSINWFSELENQMNSAVLNSQSDINQAHSIIVIGLGQTGLSCVRFLCQQGFDVVVMDTRKQPPALALVQIDYPDIIIRTGGLDRKLMLKSDMIVLSPGIDPRIEDIVEAKRAGIEIVGDIELFSRYANAPIIAITGSNGKSTVTTLLAEMAIEAGKAVQVGGNLGTPALDLISDPAPDFYIVELSSFQLETVTSLNAFASTILNITPDHLDRYDNEQAYYDAKAKIFAGDGIMVINDDDSRVKSLARSERKQLGFSLEHQKGDDTVFGLMMHENTQWIAQGSKPLIAVNTLNIVGKHNIANALAALALGSAMTLPVTMMLRALQQFTGLAHRCRLVADVKGICWFNDSKATNVGACIAAIEGFAERGKTVLIAGGEGKDQDFSKLTAVLKHHVRIVIVLGQDADLIANITPKDIPVHHVNTLLDAVIKATSVARDGDNVLLSPACASFDMFSGYAERGDMFERAVREIVND